MIPDRDDIKLIKLYTELYKIVEDIAEKRCELAKQKLSYRSAKAWGNKALKYLHRNFVEEVLREIGADKELKAFVLGYF
jgi:hypothetical protein